MDDQPLNQDVEKLRRWEEALNAGLACARECPLNTTYHERVMNAALTGLRAELAECEQCHTLHRIIRDIEESLNAPDQRQNENQRAP